jgi:Domain of unknown function (DUF4390)
MLRDVPTRTHVSRRFWAGLLLALVTGIGLAWGDTLDGALEVRSAYVNLDHGEFLLSARIEYPVSAALRAALRDGTTLAFDVEAKVERDRRFWFNATIVDLTLHRELSYHAVSDRYLVRDEKSGDQSSFATLEEALDFLGRVDAWPVLLEPELKTGTYAISVRAAMRRGHLPASLRAILFWTDDWSRVSEWYTWSLPV